MAAAGCELSWQPSARPGGAGTAPRRGADAGRGAALPAAPDAQGQAAQRVTTLVDKVRAVAAAFEDHDVPYAFGGAIALAYATEEPRGTRDVDVNLLVPADRVDEVFAALPHLRGAVARRPPGGDLRRAGQAVVARHADRRFPPPRFDPPRRRTAQPQPWSSTARSSGSSPPTTWRCSRRWFDRPKDWVDIATMIDSGDARRRHGRRRGDRAARRRRTRRPAAGHVASTLTGCDCARPASPSGPPTSCALMPRRRPRGGRDARGDPRRRSRPASPPTTSTCIARGVLERQRRDVELPRLRRLPGGHLRLGERRADPRHPRAGDPRGRRRAVRSTAGRSSTGGTATRRSPWASAQIDAARRSG